MVGSAIWRNLLKKGYKNLIGRTMEELDLTDQLSVIQLFQEEKPEYVFLAAAKVGGIVANNTYRAQFIYENLQIQNNVIHQSYVHGVKKLLFLGSSCIYPKNAPQPLKEEYLLTGKLEPTNEPYAVAKIAGIKMCEAYRDQYGCNFISVMPTNLYGPNDNYNLETSHVLPALIRKMHLGKSLENNDWMTLRKDLDKCPIEGVARESTIEEILNILDKYGVRYKKNENSTFNIQHSTLVEVEIWGTGKPKRELLHVDDMADASVFIMKNYNDKQFVNIGCGEEITIKDLGLLLKDIVGFKGRLVFNKNKLDGSPRKLLDISILNEIGWKQRIDLEAGIKSIYTKNYQK